MASDDKKIPSYRPLPAGDVVQTPGEPPMGGEERLRAKTDKERGIKVPTPTDDFTTAPLGSQQADGSSRPPLLGADVEVARPASLPEAEAAIAAVTEELKNVDPNQQPQLAEALQAKLSRLAGYKVEWSLGGKSADPLPPKLEAISQALQGEGDVGKKALGLLHVPVVPNPDKRPLLERLSISPEELQLALTGELSPALQALWAEGRAPAASSKPEDLLRHADVAMMCRFLYLAAKERLEARKDALSEELSSRAAAKAPASAMAGLKEQRAQIEQQLKSAYAEYVGALTSHTKMLAAQDQKVAGEAAANFEKAKSEKLPLAERTAAAERSAAQWGALRTGERVKGANLSALGKTEESNQAFLSAGRMSVTLGDLEVVAGSLPGANGAPPTLPNSIKAWNETGLEWDLAQLRPVTPPKPTPAGWKDPYVSGGETLRGMVEDRRADVIKQRMEARNLRFDLSDLEQQELQELEAEAKAAGEKESLTQQQIKTRIDEARSKFYEARTEVLFAGLSERDKKEALFDLSMIQTRRQNALHRYSAAETGWATAVEPPDLPLILGQLKDEHGPLFLKAKAFLVSGKLDAEAQQIQDDLSADPDAKFDDVLSVADAEKLVSDAQKALKSKREEGKPGTTAKVAAGVGTFLGPAGVVLTAPAALSSIKSSVESTDKKVARAHEVEIAKAALENAEEQLALAKKHEQGELTPQAYRVATKGMADRDAYSASLRTKVVKLTDSDAERLSLAEADQKRAEKQAEEAGKAVTKDLEKAAEIKPKGQTNLAELERARATFAGGPPTADAALSEYAALQLTLQQRIKDSPRLSPEQKQARFAEYSSQAQSLTPGATRLQALKTQQWQKANDDFAASTNRQTGDAAMRSRAEGQLKGLHGVQDFFVTHDYHKVNWSLEGLVWTSDAHGDLAKANRAADKHRKQANEHGNDANRTWRSSNALDKAHLGLVDVAIAANGLFDEQTEKLPKKSQDQARVQSTRLHGATAISASRANSPSRATAELDKAAQQQQRLGEPLTKARTAGELVVAHERAFDSAAGAARRSRQPYKTQDLIALGQKLIERKEGLGAETAGFEADAEVKASANTINELEAARLGRNLALKQAVRTLQGNELTRNDKARESLKYSHDRLHVAIEDNVSGMFWLAQLHRFEQNDAFGEWIEGEKGLREHTSDRFAGWSDIGARLEEGTGNDIMDEVMGVQLSLAFSEYDEVAGAARQAYKGGKVSQAVDTLRVADVQLQRAFAQEPADLVVTAKSLDQPVGRLATMGASFDARNQFYEDNRILFAVSQAATEQVVLLPLLFLSGGASEMATAKSLLALERAVHAGGATARVARATLNGVKAMRAAGAVIDSNAVTRVLFNVAMQLGTAEATNLVASIIGDYSKNPKAAEAANFLLGMLDVAQMAKAARLEGKAIQEVEKLTSRTFFCKVLPSTMKQMFSAAPLAWSQFYFGQVAAQQKNAELWGEIVNVGSAVLAAGVGERALRKNTAQQQSGVKSKLAQVVPEQAIKELEVAGREFYSDNNPSIEATRKYLDVVQKTIDQASLPADERAVLRQQSLALIGAPPMGAADRAKRLDDLNVRAEDRAAVEQSWVVRDLALTVPLTDGKITTDAESQAAAMKLVEALASEVRPNVGHEAMHELLTQRLLALGVPHPRAVMLAEHATNRIKLDATLKARGLEASATTLQTVGAALDGIPKNASPQQYLAALRKAAPTDQAVVDAVFVTLVGDQQAGALLQRLADADSPELSLAELKQRLEDTRQLLTAEKMPAQMVESLLADHAGQISEILLSEKKRCVQVEEGSYEIRSVRKAVPAHERAAAFARHMEALGFAGDPQIAAFAKNDVVIEVEPGTPESKAAELRDALNSLATKLTPDLRTGKLSVREGEMLLLQHARSEALAKGFELIEANMMADKLVADLRRARPELSAPVVIGHDGPAVLRTKAVADDEMLQTLSGDPRAKASDLEGLYIDGLSGALSESHLAENINYACDLADQGTHTVAVASAMMRNLSGANGELDPIGADRCLRAMHLVFQESLTRLVAKHHGEVVFHRKPGGGMMAIVVLPKGAKADLVAQAMDAARAEVDQFARQTTVTTLSGKKKTLSELSNPLDPGNPGIGLLTGTAPVKVNSSSKEVYASVAPEVRVNREAPPAPPATKPQAQLPGQGYLEKLLTDDEVAAVLRGEPLLDSSGRPRLLTSNENRYINAHLHEWFARMPIAKRQAVARKLLPNDDLTGFAKQEELIPILRDAAQLVQNDIDNGQQSCLYVLEWDIGNLGGLNRYSRETGSGVFREISRIAMEETVAEVKRLGGSVVFIRKGGDEEIAVIKLPGAASEQAAAMKALEQAVEAKVMAFCNGHSVMGRAAGDTTDRLIDLSAMPHTKEGKPPGTRGLFGVAALEGGTSDVALMEMLKRSGQAVEVKKKEAKAKADSLPPPPMAAQQGAAPRTFHDDEVTKNMAIVDEATTTLVDEPTTPLVDEPTQPHFEDPQTDVLDGLNVVKFSSPPSVVLVRRDVNSSNGQLENVPNLKLLELRGNKAVVADPSGATYQVAAEDVIYDHNGYQLGASSPVEQMRFQQRWNNATQTERDATIALMQRANHLSKEHFFMVKRLFALGYSVELCEYGLGKVAHIQQSELGAYLSPNGLTQRYLTSCVPTSIKDGRAHFDPLLGLIVQESPQIRWQQQREILARNRASSGGKEGGVARSPGGLFDPQLVQAAATLPPSLTHPEVTLHETSVQGRVDLPHVAQALVLSAQQKVPVPLLIKRDGHVEISVVRGLSQDGAYLLIQNSQGQKHYIAIENLQPNNNSIELMGGELAGFGVPPTVQVNAPDQGMSIWRDSGLQYDLEFVTGHLYAQQVLSSPAASDNAAHRTMALSRAGFPVPLAYTLYSADGQVLGGHQTIVVKHKFDEFGVERVLLIDPEQPEGKWFTQNELRDYMSDQGWRLTHMMEPTLAPPEQYEASVLSKHFASLTDPAMRLPLENSWQQLSALVPNVADREEMGVTLQVLLQEAKDNKRSPVPILTAMNKLPLLLPATAKTLRELVALWELSPETVTSLKGPLSRTAKLGIHTVLGPAAWGAQHGLLFYPGLIKRLARADLQPEMEAAVSLALVSLPNDPVMHAVVSELLATQETPQAQQHAALELLLVLKRRLAGQAIPPDVRQQIRQHAKNDTLASVSPELAIGKKLQVLLSDPRQAHAVIQAQWNLARKAQQDLGLLAALLAHIEAVLPREDDALANTVRPEDLAKMRAATPPSPSIVLASGSAGLRDTIAIPEGPESRARAGWADGSKLSGSLENLSARFVVDGHNQLFELSRNAENQLVLLRDGAPPILVTDTTASELDLRSLAKAEVYGLPDNVREALEIPTFLVEKSLLPAFRASALASARRKIDETPLTARQRACAENELLVKEKLLMQADLVRLEQRIFPDEGENAVVVATVRDALRSTLPIDVKEFVWRDVARVEQGLMTSLRRASLSEAEARVIADRALAAVGFLAFADAGVATPYRGPDPGDGLLPALQHLATELESPSLWVKGIASLRGEVRQEAQALRQADDRPQVERRAFVRVLMRRLEAYGLKPESISGIVTSEEFQQMLSRGGGFVDVSFRGQPHGDFTHVLQLLLLAPAIEKSLGGRSTAPRTLKEFITWMGTHPEGGAVWKDLFDAIPAAIAPDVPGALYSPRAAENVGPLVNSMLLNPDIEEAAFAKRYSLTETRASRRIEALREGWTARLSALGLGGSAKALCARWLKEGTGSELTADTVEFVYWTERSVEWLVEHSGGRLSAEVAQVWVNEVLTEFRRRPVPRNETKVWLDELGVAPDQRKAFAKEMSALRDAQRQTPVARDEYLTKFQACLERHSTNKKKIESEVALELMRESVSEGTGPLVGAMVTELQRVEQHYQATDVSVALELLRIARSAPSAVRGRLENALRDGNHSPLILGAILSYMREGTSRGEQNNACALIEAIAQRRDHKASLFLLKQLPAGRVPTHAELQAATKAAILFETTAVETTVVETTVVGTAGPTPPRKREQLQYPLAEAMPANAEQRQTLDHFAQGRWPEDVLAAISQHFGGASRLARTAEIEAWLQPLKLSEPANPADVVELVRLQVLANRLAIATGQPPSKEHLALISREFAIAKSTVRTAVVVDEGVTASMTSAQRLVSSLVARESNAYHRVQSAAISLGALKDPTLSRALIERVPGHETVDVELIQELLLKRTLTEPNDSGFFDDMPLRVALAQSGIAQPFIQRFILELAWERDRSVQREFAFTEPVALFERYPSMKWVKAAFESRVDSINWTSKLLEEVAVQKGHFLEDHGSDVSASTVFDAAVWTTLEQRMKRMGLSLTRIQALNEAMSSADFFAALGQGKLLVDPAMMGNQHGHLCHALQMVRALEVLFEKTGKAGMDDLTALAQPSAQDVGGSLWAYLFDSVVDGTYSSPQLVTALLDTALEGGGITRVLANDRRQLNDAKAQALPVAAPIIYDSAPIVLLKPNKLGQLQEHAGYQILRQQGGIATIRDASGKESQVPMADVVFDHDFTLGAASPLILRRFDERRARHTTSKEEGKAIDRLMVQAQGVSTEHQALVQRMYAAGRSLGEIQQLFDSASRVSQQGLGIIFSPSNIAPLWDATCVPTASLRAVAGLDPSIVHVLEKNPGLLAELQRQALVRFGGGGKKFEDGQEIHLTPRLSHPGLVAWSQTEVSSKTSSSTHPAEQVLYDLSNASVTVADAQQTMLDGVKKFEEDVRAGQFATPPTLLFDRRGRIESWSFVSRDSSTGKMLFKGGTPIRSESLDLSMLTVKDNSLHLPVLDEKIVGVRVHQDIRLPLATAGTTLERDSVLLGLIEMYTGHHYMKEPVRRNLPNFTVSQQVEGAFEQVNEGYPIFARLKDNNRGHLVLLTGPLRLIDGVWKARVQDTGSEKSYWLSASEVEHGKLDGWSQSTGWTLAAFYRPATGPAADSLPGLVSQPMFAGVTDSTTRANLDSAYASLDVTAADKQGVDQVVKQALAQLSEAGESTSVLLNAMRTAKRLAPCTASCLRDAFLVERTYPRLADELPARLSSSSQATTQLLLSAAAVGAQQGLFFYDKLLKQTLSPDNSAPRLKNAVLYALSCYPHDVVLHARLLSVLNDRTLRADPTSALERQIFLLVEAKRQGKSLSEDDVMHIANHAASGPEDKVVALARAAAESLSLVAAEPGGLAFLETHAVGIAIAAQEGPVELHGHLIVHSADVLPLWTRNREQQDKVKHVLGMEDSLSFVEPHASSTQDRLLQQQALRDVSLAISHLYEPNKGTHPAHASLKLMVEHVVRYASSGRLPLDCNKLVHNVQVLAQAPGGAAALERLFVHGHNPELVVAALASASQISADTLDQTRVADLQTWLSVLAYNSPTAAVALAKSFAPAELPSHHQLFAVHASVTGRSLSSVLSVAKKLGSPDLDAKALKAIASVPNNGGTHKPFEPSSDRKYWSEGPAVVGKFAQERVLMDRLAKNPAALDAELEHLWGKQNYRPTHVIALRAAVPRHQAAVVVETLAGLAVLKDTPLHLVTPEMPEAVYQALQKAGCDEALAARVARHVVLDRRWRANEQNAEKNASGVPGMAPTEVVIQLARSLKDRDATLQKLEALWAEASAIAAESPALLSDEKASGKKLKSRVFAVPRGLMLRAAMAADPSMQGRSGLMMHGASKAFGSIVEAPDAPLIFDGSAAFASHGTDAHVVQEVLIADILRQRSDPPFTVAELRQQIGEKGFAELFDMDSGSSMSNPESLTSLLKLMTVDDKPGANFRLEKAAARFDALIARFGLLQSSEMGKVKRAIFRAPAKLGPAELDKQVVKLMIEDTPGLSPDQARQWFTTYQARAALWSTLVDAERGLTRADKTDAVEKFLLQMKVAPSLARATAEKFIHSAGWFALDVSLEQALEMPLKPNGLVTSEVGAREYTAKVEKSLSVTDKQNSPLHPHRKLMTAMFGRELGSSAFEALCTPPFEGVSAEVVKAVVTAAGMTVQVEVRDGGGLLVAEVSHTFKRVTQPKPQLEVETSLVVQPSYESSGVREALLAQTGLGLRTLSRAPVQLAVTVEGQAAFAAALYDFTSAGTALVELKQKVIQFAENELSRGGVSAEQLALFREMVDLAASPRDLALLDVPGTAVRLQRGLGDGRKATKLGQAALMSIGPVKLTQGSTELSQLHRKIGVHSSFEAMKKVVGDRQKELQNTDALNEVGVPHGELTAWGQGVSKPTTGDFMQVKLLRDGRVAFFMGDAMGHDLAAAVDSNDMHRVLAESADSIESAKSADEVLRAIDLAAQPRFEDRQFSMSTVLFDPKTGQLEVAGANMPPLFVRRANGQVEQILPDGGGYVGDSLVGYSNAAVGDKKLKLAPGDMILLSTDGLFDALGDQSVTGDPLRQLLQHASSPKAVLDGVREQLPNSHLGDDASVLVYKFAGNS